MNPDNQYGSNPQAAPEAGQAQSQQYDAQPTMGQPTPGMQSAPANATQQPMTQVEPAPVGVAPQPAVTTASFQNTPAAPRSKKGIILTAAGVLLVAALAGGWYIMRPDPKPQNSNHSQNTATNGSGSQSDSSDAASNAAGISVGQTKSDVENGPAKGIRPLCSVTDGAEKCSYYGVSGKKVTVTYDTSGTVAAVQVK